MVILNKQGKKKRRLTKFEKRLADLDLILERTVFDTYLRRRHQENNVMMPIDRNSVW